MSAFIGTIVVGIICIVIGVLNMRGNISSIHSYHRHRVSEEDRLPFGRLVGLGTVIIGASVIVFGGLSMVTLLTSSQVYTWIGTAVLVVGIALGLGLSFYAMKKYNKGIF